MTQLELEEKITMGDPGVAASQSVVMIQCVGCRQEDRNYCARICPDNRGTTGVGPSYQIEMSSEIRQRRAFSGLSGTFWQPK
jgi:hypothetical protein